MGTGTGFTFTLTLLAVLGAAPILARAAVLSDVNIRLAQQQGPNTCVVEEVPGTKHKIWTECTYWVDRDICGRKAVVRYDCCEGFSRVEGQPGCGGVLPLRDLVETARAAGASRFAALLQSSGLAEQLRGEGAAFTLFAPSDQAMDELSASQTAALREARADNPILNHHIVANKHVSRSWGANQLLPSRLRGTNLRVNKYSSKIETVNCATVLRKDQEASNGVVHIVDTLLDPERSTHADLATAVVQDGRFLELSRLMQRTRLFDSLRRENVAYTLLAPNDEAFRKLPASRLQRIAEDPDAREALLRHLVLPHPVCVGAVLGPHRLHTHGDQSLAFTCDQRGVFVEGLRFGAEMQLAADGVLYMLDDVILPDRAKTLLQLVQDERLYSFAEAVRTAGLEALMDGSSDHTLFAPSEAAFAALPYGQQTRIRSDPEAARRFVMLHLSRGRLLTQTITDNQIVQSLENDELRLQVYRKAYGVEDAVIEKSDVQGINGVLHVISKALRQASGTLEETLRQDGNYTTFLRVLNRLQTDSPGSLELRARDTAYTFLVPTDQAFQRLGAARLQHLLSNTSLLARTVKNHVVDDMMGTESFRENLQYTVPSKQSNLHVVRRDGKLKVNDAMVLTCDRTNRQGVVHYINKVLLPDDQHVTIPPARSGYRFTNYTEHHWEHSNHHVNGQVTGDDTDYEEAAVAEDAEPQPEVYRRPQQEHRFREDTVYRNRPRVSYSSSRQRISQ